MFTHHSMQLWVRAANSFVSTFEGAAVLVAAVNSLPSKLASGAISRFQPLLGASHHENNDRLENLTVTCFPGIIQSFGSRKHAVLLPSRIPLVHRGYHTEHRQSSETQSIVSEAQDRPPARPQQVSGPNSNVESSLDSQLQASRSSSTRSRQSVIQAQTSVRNVSGMRQTAKPGVEQNPYGEWTPEMLQSLLAATAQHRGFLKADRMETTVSSNISTIRTKETSSATFTDEKQPHQAIHVIQTTATSPIPSSREGQHPELKREVSGVPLHDSDQAYAAGISTMQSPATKEDATSSDMDATNQSRGGSLITQSSLPSSSATPASADAAAVPGVQVKDAGSSTASKHTASPSTSTEGSGSITSHSSDHYNMVDGGRATVEYRRLGRRGRPFDPVSNDKVLQQAQKMKPNKNIKAVIELGKVDVREPPASRRNIVSDSPTGLTWMLGLIVSGVQVMTQPLISALTKDGKQVTTRLAMKVKDLFDGLRLNTEDGIKNHGGAIVAGLQDALAQHRRAVVEAYTDITRTLLSIPSAVSNMSTVIAVAVSNFVNRIVSGMTAAVEAFRLRVSQSMPAAKQANQSSHLQEASSTHSPAANSRTDATVLDEAQQALQQRSAQVAASTSSNETTTATSNLKLSTSPLTMVDVSKPATTATSVVGSEMTSPSARPSAGHHSEQPSVAQMSGGLQEIGQQESVTSLDWSNSNSHAPSAPASAQQPQAAAADGSIQLNLSPQMLAEYRERIARLKPLVPQVTALASQVFETTTSVESSRSKHMKTFRHQVTRRMDTTASSTASLTGSNKNTASIDTSAAQAMGRSRQRMSKYGKQNVDALLDQMPVWKKLQPPQRQPQHPDSGSVATTAVNGRLQPAGTSTAAVSQVSDNMGWFVKQLQDKSSTSAVHREEQARAAVNETAPQAAAGTSHDDVHQQAASARKAVLLDELSRLQSQMSSVKAQLDMVILDAYGQSNPNADGSSALRISIGSVAGLAQHRKNLKTKISKCEEEMRRIDKGTWTAPASLTAAASSTQFSQPDHTTAQAQPLEPAVSNDETLQDLLQSFMADLTSNTAAATATATAKASSSSNKGASSQVLPPSTHSTTSKAVPAAGQESHKKGDQSVASWVDNLRDVLGPTTSLDGSSMDGTAGKQQHSTRSSSDEQSTSAVSADGSMMRSGPEARDLGSVHIPAGITVRGLSSLLGCSPVALETWLREEAGEVVSSPEDVVTAEAAELAALEWGRTPVMTGWEETMGPAVPRPPVVTIMGHVDHGKTSLLDALRSSNIAQGEAGGITQHIGAFEVRLPGWQLPITFLDTPGHAAFSAMRARGAAVTDIVVLVVAADDGVMPQTREALAHARSSGCPIVVALTKCDLPGARVDGVKQALLQEGVELEEYGGNVQVLETSAKTGAGLQQLQEALLIQAEEMSLRSVAACPAKAVVVESSQGRSGPQATVIVKEGQLKVGDPLVVGSQFGRVRALRSSNGHSVGPEGVGPGYHALLQGLRGLPQPGDVLQVVSSEDRARKMSEARSARQEDIRMAQLQAQRHKEQQQVATETAAHAAVSTTTSSSSSQPQEGSTMSSAAHTSEVRLVVKADVQGSVEAVRALADQLSSEHVNIKVLHAGVGPLTLGDVNLAVAAGAHLVTFALGGGVGSNTQVEAALKDAVKQHGVKHFSHNIVYHLMDELRAVVQGATPYIDVEEVIGSAEVRASFPLSAATAKKAGLAAGEGRIAGLQVMQGSLRQESTRVRVVRAGQVIFEGAITSLKRHKLDVNQVGQGTECGLVLEHGKFSDWQAGDVVECVASVRKRADDASVAGGGGGSAGGAGTDNSRSDDGGKHGRDESQQQRYEKVAAYGR